MPIVVNPALKEVKNPDYTEGGTLPEGKPGSQGVPKSYLEAAIAAHPRSAGGSADLDTCIQAEKWWSATQPYSEQMAAFNGLPAWLATRPEERIAVVTHGGILTRLLKTEVGHGQVSEREREKSPQFSAPSQPLCIQIHVVSCAYIINNQVRREENSAEAGCSRPHAVHPWGAA